MNTLNPLYRSVQLFVIAVLSCLFIPKFGNTQSLVRHLLTPEVVSELAKVDSLRS